MLCRLVEVRVCRRQARDVPGPGLGAVVGLVAVGGREYRRLVEGDEHRLAKRQQVAKRPRCQREGGWTSITITSLRRDTLLGLARTQTGMARNGTNRSASPRVSAREAQQDSQDRGGAWHGPVDDAVGGEQRQHYQEAVEALAHQRPVPRDERRRDRGERRGNQADRSPPTRRPR